MQRLSFTREAMRDGSRKIGQKSIENLYKIIVRVALMQEDR
jgi:hypothetical protein